MKVFLWSRATFEPHPWECDDSDSESETSTTEGMEQSCTDEKPWDFDDHGEESLLLEASLLLDENPKTTQAPFTAGKKVPKVKDTRCVSTKTLADIKCIRRAGVPCKTPQQTE